MARRPNVIFVLTDDQGYPPLGAHGHPFVRTPHLDAFHADAVRFEQFHSGATCAPTRAGLMTGHYCNSTGVWHKLLSAKAVGPVTIGLELFASANDWHQQDVSAAFDNFSVSAPHACQ